MVRKYLYPAKIGDISTPFYSTITLTSFLCILIADVIIRINSFIGAANGSTEAVAGLQFVAVLSLLLLCRKLHFKNKIPHKSLFVFKLFMAWNIFSFIWGGFHAQNYWDWKTLLLNYSFFISVPLAIIIGIHYETTIKAFRFILRKVFLFGFVFILFARATDYELYSRVVIGVSLFILFVPYLKFKWRVLIFIVALASVVTDISYRSNVIRILIPITLLLMYYWKRFINHKLLNVVSGVLFCLPLLFLFLGASGQFNVFQENIFDYKIYTGSNTNKREINFNKDTRTFLYEEVFQSMKKRNSSFIIGEGGGAAYETYAFANLMVSDRGRYGSEVGFLNTLLYSGIIGALLYAWMLFTAVYYAINRSNNYLCKMLSMFLVFHWVWFFIEDITKFDLNFYFIWIVIGLCLSNKFRRLSDFEVKQFFGLISKPVRSTTFNNVLAGLADQA